MWQKLLVVFCMSLSLQCWGNPGSELLLQYERARSYPSDIYEHVPTLCSLASECSSIAECGLRDMTSTWGLLAGLMYSSAEKVSYLGIDISSPPEATLHLAKRLSSELGMEFHFLQANDLDVEIDAVDLLFIDTWHTYRQLTCELEKFASSVKKYIVIHDTSDPYGNQDAPNYYQFTQLPECPSVSIDPSKQGLWTAVVDFLGRHSEWVLKRRDLNCHGLTVLSRCKLD